MLTRTRLERLMLTAFAVLLFSLSLRTAALCAPASAPAARKSPAAPPKGSTWMAVWPDGTPTGAQAALSLGVLTVTGQATSKSYGGVYKKLDVDLDKTPTMVVDVQSVSAFWYLVVKNGNIKEGYVKVQNDTNMLGRQVFDLRTVTGLSGKQNIEIEIGVSSGREDEPNTGKTLVVKDIVFTPRENGTMPGALRLSPWKNKWPDGTDTGATVKEEAASFTVTGTAKDRSYGSVFRIVTVDLDRTPYLKLTPLTLGGVWYLEAAGGGLKAPVKIQADTDARQTQTYSLKELLALSGSQSFELHIGVGSGNQEPNAGKQVTFSNDIGFFAAGK